MSTEFHFELIFGLSASGSASVYVCPGIVSTLVKIQLFFECALYVLIGLERKVIPYILLCPTHHIAELRFDPYYLNGNKLSIIIMTFRLWSTYTCTTWTEHKTFESISHLSIDLFKFHCLAKCTVARRPGARVPLIKLILLLCASNWVAFCA